MKYQLFAFFVCLHDGWVDLYFNAECWYRHRMKLGECADFFFDLTFTPEDRTINQIAIDLAFSDAYNNFMNRW